MLKQKLLNLEIVHKYVSESNGFFLTNFTKQAMIDFGLSISTYQNGPNLNRPFFWKKTPLHSCCTQRNQINQVLLSFGIKKTGYEYRSMTVWCQTLPDDAKVFLSVSFNANRKHLLEVPCTAVISCNQRDSLHCLKTCRLISGWS